jgi:hypothetical protein
MRATTISLIILLINSIVFAQAPINFDSLVSASAATFNGQGPFSGKPWDQLVERSAKANYLLIGEDHFISEVPLFTQALVQDLHIDNYICEIDQWMLNIFKDKLSTLSAAQLEQWISENYNGFSFFQKKNEFELLRYLLQQNINLIGIEQVGLMSTTIILQYLTETGSQKNRGLYKVMRDSSAASNKRFSADYSKKFFLATSFFREAVNKLDRSNLTPDETKLIEALIRSADIYSTGSHRNRIKLMQSNLLENYPQTLKGKKNLFKFGANHPIKGESYLPVYDIGTTAHIMAQGENQDSYHILILPKAGDQAGFLSGSNPIDLNDELYRSLKPLFEKASDSEWTSINLENIRNEAKKKKYVINNPTLEKTINGYDLLVVIPLASAAKAIR